MSNARAQSASHPPLRARLEAARPPASGGSDLEALLAERFDDPALLRLAGPRAAALPGWMLGRTLWRPAARFVRHGGKRVRADLVRLGWTLGGGRGDCPPCLADTVELLHAGALIVDDIQDGATRRRGRPALHRVIGMPLALNVGNWLYFWPLERLAGLDAPPATQLALHRHAVAAIVRCHVGQALDVGLRVHAVPRRHVAATTRAISELKTGSLTDLAIALGAVAAGAERRRVAALRRFGARLGIGLQMLNDLADLGDGCGDLRSARVTWPWAWAAERVPAPAYRRLRDEARAVAEDGARRARLGRTLEAAVGAHGRRVAHAWLARAAAALRAHVGPHPAIDATVRRLEARRG